MNRNAEVSDEMLNAFADDELDATEKARLLNRMAEDVALRGRVCQIWQMKELLRGAYPQTEVPAPRRHGRASRFARYGQALAASLILGLGAAMGWFAHGGLGDPAELHLSQQQMAEGKVILHLDTSDPERLRVAVNEAERLTAEKDKSGHLIQVELVANGGGLDLLRDGVSPYADRLENLARVRGNLSLLACATAIEKARASGADVKLLPHVIVTSSALDQIMLRLQQGWTYIQI